MRDLLLLPLTSRESTTEGIFVGCIEEGTALEVEHHFLGTIVFTGLVTLLTIDLTELLEGLLTVLIDELQELDRDLTRLEELLEVDLPLLMAGPLDSGLPF